MDKATEREILKIYNKVYEKVYNRGGVLDLARGIRTSIFSNAINLENSDAYDKFAEEFAKELAKKGLSKKRGVWRKFYEAAKKAHYVGLPTTFHEYEMKAYADAVRHNFKMIKSIPTKTLEIMEHKYTSTLIEEVAKGNLSRGSFRKELASHGHKNAKLIARTESAKLQTAITEVRAKNIGSVAYIWLSSNDRRTRPSHREMNGVVVFWREDAQKPLLDKMRGNAGEFPNCRCDAQPIVDVDDLTKSTYEVYDYDIDRVVKMSKNKLIEALEKGEL